MLIIGLHWLFDVLKNYQPNQQLCIFRKDKIENYSRSKVFSNSKHKWGKYLKGQNNLINFEF